MNSKKVNWFFLTTILLHVFTVVLVVVFRYVYTLDIITNFVLSSAIIVVPALAFSLGSEDRIHWFDKIGFHKIKWSTAAMIAVITFLVMPLTTVINAFSMLFVENTVVQMSGQVLKLPLPAAFFFIAVSAPFFEELVFRGVVYRGYKRSGNICQAAVFSALLFAMGHMNFNQAAYAFVLGIVLVLLVEATGSLWASVIFHMIFNGYSVVMMYFADRVLQDFYEQDVMEQAGTEEMLYAIGLYLMIAAVTTAVAVCAFVWIAKNENRTEYLLAAWRERKNGRGRMVTIPFVIGTVLCVLYMLLDAGLMKWILQTVSR